MMTSWFRLRPGWIALLTLCLLSVASCSPAVEEQPTISPTQADLTTLDTIVKLLRGDIPETVVDKDETVSVEVNDRIAVDEAGRGLLRFHDRMVVELFRGTELQLSDARLEASESIFVRFRQTFGHTRTKLNSEANARISLETDFATITSLVEDTEILVCHDPALLTCMVALSGEVDVTAQDVTVKVKGGESTYIFAGEPPVPPICVNTDAVEDWLDRKRSVGDIEALGELVAGWPNEPCSSGIAETPETDSPLPQPEGMVRIEEGFYTVGNAQADDNHIASQELSVSTFWIDTLEVTNSQYQVFLDQTGHPAPAPGIREPNFPIQGVTWDDAAAYCSWAKKRLPTEAEWEVAARGPGAEPPLYPWGDDPAAGGQISELPLDSTYEVGTFAFNRSPLGIYDMAGNVWEWVGQPYARVPDDLKILRGGRFGLIRDNAYRQQTETTNERFVPFAGFRCAADQVQGE